MKALCSLFTALAILFLPVTAPAVATQTSIFTQIAVQVALACNATSEYVIPDYVLTGSEASAQLFPSLGLIAANTPLGDYMANQLSGDILFAFGAPGTGFILDQVLARGGGIVRAFSKGRTVQCATAGNNAIPATTTQFPVTSRSHSVPAALCRINATAHFCFFEYRK